MYYSRKQKGFPPSEKEFGSVEGSQKVKTNYEVSGFAFFTTNSEEHCSKSEMNQKWNRNQKFDT